MTGSGRFVLSGAFVAAVASLIVAIVTGVRSDEYESDERQSRASLVGYTPSTATEPPRQARESAETNTFTETVPDPVVVGDDAREPEYPAGDADAPDVSAHLEEVSKQARHYVEGLYPLLVDHLGLDTQETTDFFELLIEMRVEETTLLSQGEIILRGKSIAQDERNARIAAVIGESKLGEFLTLARNLSSYSEIAEAGSLLQSHGAPLTASQRDALFSTFVDVEARRTTLFSGDRRDLIAVEEYVTVEKNEFERHVMELAPSLLTPDQVVILDRRYQQRSYERASHLERAKRQRENGWLRLN